MNEQILKSLPIRRVAKTLQRTCELMFKTNGDSRSIAISH